MTTITFKNLPDGTVDVQLHDPAGEPESSASNLAAFLFSQVGMARRAQAAFVEAMASCGYGETEIRENLRAAALRNALEVGT